MSNGSDLGFLFGLGVAIGINQLAWWLRSRCLSIPAVLGTVWGVIATVGLAHLALTASGFADGIPQFMFGAWLVFLVIISGVGVLHAKAIPCDWGSATAAILFESLMACVGIYFVHCQLHSIMESVSDSYWFINSFEDAARPALIVSLLLLTLISPMWRRNRLHQSAI